jgi:hypothetical protein
MYVHGILDTLVGLLTGCTDPSRTSEATLTSRKVTDIAPRHGDGTSSSQPDRPRAIIKLAIGLSHFITTPAARRNQQDLISLGTKPSQLPNQRCLDRSDRR